jgi:hypothetical protein
MSSLTYGSGPEPERFPLPRVLTAGRAAERGLSEGRVRTELRTGRWRRLGRGVYLTRVDFPTRADWARAGLAVAGPIAILSGWDALRCYGLGSNRPPADDVLVLTTEGTNRRFGPVRIRPSARPVSSGRPPHPEPDLRFMPIVSAGRAVADTALSYRWPEPVRAMVTEAVQRGLCTVEELVAELDAGPRNGSANLRIAVEDVLGGARSIAEAVAADVLRAGNLPLFELNVPILDENGRLGYVADALWRDLRAALEIDSRRHHFLEPAWERTMDRHNALARFGLSTTHYPPKAFRDRGPAVADEVEGWLRTRAAELDLPYVPVPNQPPSRVPPEPYRVHRRYDRPVP